MGDTVTILTTQGKILATKRHVWDGSRFETHPYGEARTYTTEVVEVADLAGLSELLDRLEQAPKSFVVRAQPLEGNPPKVRRLLHRDNQAKTDAEAGPFFEPHPEGRHWVCLDLDKAPVPPETVGEGPCPAVVRWAVEKYLPAAFHGVSVRYQWSSSCGVKNWHEGLRLHLWFWFDERVCEDSLVAWAKTVPVVDPSTLRPITPNYTACPIFEGAQDPLTEAGAERSGLLEGERHEVVTADVRDAHGPVLLGADDWVTREARRIDIYTDTAGSLASGLKSEGRIQAWAKKKLEESIREIHGLADGTRNNLLWAICYSLGRVVDPAGLPALEVQHALEQAAVAVGSNKAKDLDTVRRAFEKGREQPRDLSQLGQAPAPKPEPAKAAEATTPKQAVAPEEYHCQRDRRLTVGGHALVPSDKGLVLGAQAVPGVYGAPQPDARVPVGYFVAPWGTGWHSGEKSGLIVPAPVVIAGRSEDADTGELQLLVAWKAPDGWRRRLLPRVEAMGRGVIVLAKYGLPVTADGTKGLNRYLLAFEAENYRSIPTLKTSRSLGWQGEAGASGCLVGTRHFMAGREARVDIERWTNEQLSDDAVAFQPTDSGDRALASAFRTRGTWSTWVDALRAMAAYPKASLAVLASLAAPVLEVVGARGFAVDWSGPSSTGKSLVLRFAASVWGDPLSMVRTWDASDTYLERTLGTLRHFPLFMDETQRLVKAAKPGSEQLVNQALYMVENGYGRGRANLGHSQVTQSWRTIMLSTGEVPATTIGDAKGGANARAVLVQGPPFGRGQQSALAMLLDDVARSHYGLAGERWVKWLVANRAKWPEWAELHDGLRRDYLQDTRSGAESRLAGARAALEVTRQLAEQALCLRMGDPLAIWGQLTGHAEDATGEQRALEELGAWVFASREHFIGSGYTADRAPSGGWLGVVRQKEGEVAIVPSALEEQLRRRGHQPRAVLEAWRERGWLLLDTSDGDRSGRLTRKVSMHSGARVRCYVLPTKLVFDDAETGAQQPLGTAYH